MRMSREALVYRAVAVLDEVMADCARAPVKAGPGLRLALAYLYSISDDKPLPRQHLRQDFDEYLAAVTDPRETAMPAKDARGRAADALSAFNRICRRCGYGVETRARAETARRLFSAEIDRVEAARQRNLEAERNCPIQRPMRDRWK